MSEQNEHTDPAHSDADHVERTSDDDRRTVVRERERLQPVTEQRTLSGRSFLAGFLTAAVAAAIALVVFLAVSDADDDGEIQVDVPAVDVDVDG